MHYLDSSALVKLVYVEAESTALDAYLMDAALISSEVALIEVRRVALRHSVDGARATMEAIEGRLALVAFDNSIRDSAAWLAPASLRTLDAVHVATALSIRDDLDVLVTYDRRMLEAAALHGLRAVSPGPATT